MTEKSFKYDWQPHIQAIGKPAGALKAFLKTDKLLTLPQNTEQKKKWLGSSSEISSSNGIFSVIDDKGNLWVVGNIFCQPVNISELIHIKAKKVFVGEGQLLFQNKLKGIVLITWASKPEFKHQKLRKLSVVHGRYSHLIDAYSLEDEIEEAHLWHYNSVKNLQYQIKLFKLNVLTQEIIGFPSEKIIKMEQKPAGMSIGKYHGLIWSESGQLFGWGCKTLGLGLKIYTKNYYDDLQQINLPQPIIKAVASTNYSLALGVSGQVYEWGMQEERQPILTPRVLNIKGLKFVSIKGNSAYFGGLTQKNHLYLWGRGVSQLFGQDFSCIDPFEIQKAESIKIVDFQLQENYVIVLLTQDKGVLNQQQKSYFSSMISKVTAKWLPNRAKKNTNKLTEKHQRHYSPPCSSTMMKQQDYIDRLIEEKISKEKYMVEMQDQEVLFNKLMANTTPMRILEEIHNEPMQSSRGCSKRQRPKHRKVESTRETLNYFVDNENVDKLIKQFQDQQKHKRNNLRRRKGFVSSNTRKLQNYQQRKEAAAFRREQMIQAKITETVAKRKTIIKEETVSICTNDDYMKMMSNCFIKAFLIKFLKEPLLYAKHIKLKQRRSQQSFNKIANNMKNILGRQRAVYYIKILQEEHPSRYDLMKRVVGGAMRKWKENKINTARRKILHVLVMSILKQKLKKGLGTIWVQVRKIQKLTRWLNHENSQRFVHLRSLWKKTLLTYIKPTPSFLNKNPSACRQELSCKPFFEKFKCPKFEQSLKHSPIISFKLPFPMSLQKLEKNRNQIQLQSDLFSKTQTIDLKKRVSWAENSQLDWKTSTLSREFDRKSTHFSHHNGIIDILLYSFHYDCFCKPKNCQINVPDNMKLSDKWVSQERKIFEKVLKDIMLQQWRQFWKSRREFETNLALFVKDNYENLSQYRWKYILQFNQLKNHPELDQSKKQRELKRILSLIGEQSILFKDVIPQKQKTLDFISKIKGAPMVPVYETTLGHQLFRKQFKKYYETVLNRAKQIRKMFS